MAPGIDLVVVNYHTEHDLAAFLDAYSDVVGEVPMGLTVVNVEADAAGSRVTDRWAAELESMEHGVEFSDNVGYARACNHAALAGEREIIGFFNADTRLKPGVLAGVLEHFQEHPSTAVVGPKQIDDNGKLTHAGIVGTNTAPVLRGWMAKDRGQFDDVLTNCVSVMGSAYFVRRSVWNELTDCPLYRDVAPDAAGAFLPTQHYYEETWCSYHARAHGWDVAYLGTVSMIHRWHKASPQGGFADRLFKTSQAYFREACDHHSIERD